MTQDNPNTESYVPLKLRRISAVEREPQGCRLTILQYVAVSFFLFEAALILDAKCTHLFMHEKETIVAPVTQDTILSQKTGYTP